MEQQLTTDQQALLTFIRGEGHHYGPGITTHSYYGVWDAETTEAKRSLHLACLELEKIGAIHRDFETEYTVQWSALEVD